MNPELKDALAKVEGGIDALTASHKAAIAGLTDRLEDLESRRKSPGKTADLSAQIKALATFARTGEMPAEFKAMSIASGPDGGVTVPVELAAELDKIAKPLSPVRALARIYPSAAGDFRIPLSVGGTGASWAAESTSRADTNTPTLAEIQPDGGELFAVAKVSQWLMDDSTYNLDAWLMTELAEQFAVSENTAFTSGDATNKPKGFTTYTTAATADAARAFGTIEHLATGVSADFAASHKGDKLIELVYRLKAAYRPGAVWMMPAAVAAEVRAFKATDGKYLWTESLAPGEPPTLLGFPVHENEDMPAKGANSLSIAFGNFNRGYGVVDRVNMRLVRDVYTEKGHVKLYCFRRVYGAVTDSNAIKFLKFGTA